MILLDDCENPYWDDAIDKYLKRPQDIVFNEITSKISSSNIK